MDAYAFQHWLGQLTQLNTRQKNLLRCRLQKRPQQDALHDNLPAPQACPHCAASDAPLAPWGWSRGLRRYRCRECRRTCNALTATPLARLRQVECWLDYSQALVEGLTVREAA